MTAQARRHVRMCSLVGVDWLDRAAWCHSFSVIKWCGIAFTAAIKLPLNGRQGPHYDIYVVQISARYEVLELMGYIFVHVWLGHKLIHLNVTLHPAFPHLQRFQLASLHAECLARSGHSSLQLYFLLYLDAQCWSRGTAWHWWLASSEDGNVWPLLTTLMGSMSSNFSVHLI